MGPKFRSDLPHKPLERELADQQLVLFCYFLICLCSTTVGLNRWGFFTPPVARADFWVALVARLHAKAYASGRLSGSQLGEKH
ncbi:hypothetical protein EV2_039141 [Malus domestica]